VSNDLLIRGWSGCCTCPRQRRQLFQLRDPLLRVSPSLALRPHLHAPLYLVTVRMRAWTQSVQTLCLPIMPTRSIGRSQPSQRGHSPLLLARASIPVTRSKRRTVCDLTLAT
jgi:hypothetical protein